MSKSAEQPTLTDHRGLLWNLTSSFLLTLTNPMTILFFAATFSAIGNNQPSHSFLGSLLIVCGVAMGSILWWVILSNGVSMMKRFASPKFLQWIHYFSGIIIIFFGLNAILSLNFLS
jgi:threonine/homoserine/homoserine lactone efflux protein